MQLLCQCGGQAMPVSHRVYTAGEIPEPQTASRSPHDPGQVGVRHEIHGALFAKECGGEIVEKTLATQNEGLFVRAPGKEVDAGQPA